MDRYVRHYDVPFIDDLHNFFPAFLYDQQQFRSVPDVFRYMNQQMDRNFNLFSSAQREYNRANPIIPIRTTQYPEFRSAIRSARIIDMEARNALTEYLIALMQVPPQQQTMEPVVVAASQLTIDDATTLRAALAADEQQSCSICQDSYTEGQALRTITHCSHIFHKNCIDTWFGHNVRCPSCRYDIRGR